MRAQAGTVTALSLVALAAGSAPQASLEAQDPGRLSGVTQISYGCPGPQREGEACEHWFSFAHARFQVARVGGTSARTITSDGRGRFTLLLGAGRYRLTPLRQTQTNGGTVVVVTVRTGATTWARVRFEGFPRML
jgi:hypothetical protein